MRGVCLAIGPTHLHSLKEGFGNLFSALGSWNDYSLPTDYMFLEDCRVAGSSMLTGNYSERLNSQEGHNSFLRVGNM